MRREVFATPEPPELEIRLAAGDIDVETSDSTETVVELDALNDRARQALEDATVALRGNRIVVEIEPKRRVIIGRSASIRVSVKAPHGSALEVRSAAADVSASGRYADVTVKTAAGDLTVDEIAGRFELNTVSGDAKVSRVGGDAAVTTISGDVRVHELDGDLRVTSVSGDIEIETIGGRKIEAKSVSGDVRLGIRRGSSVFLDVSSVSGKTTSELSAEDGPPAEGPSVELRAKTVSGDVRIVRGAGARV